MAKKRKGKRKWPKLQPQSRRRVSEKIERLVREGIPDGRGQAGAMAHSMERAGRLGRSGKYYRVGRRRRDKRSRRRRSRRSSRR